MFDPFKFLEERRAGMPLSEEDKAEFVLYNVVQGMSMDYRYRRMTHMANDLSFSHLPRDIQAMAMRSLNNATIDTRWHRAKTTAIKDRDEEISKAMVILRMPHSSVVAAMQYNLIDMDAVNEAYTRRYEPQKLLEGKRKAKK